MDDFKDDKKFEGNSEETSILEHEFAKIDEGFRDIKPVAEEKPEISMAYDMPGNENTAPETLRTATEEKAEPVAEVPGRPLKGNFKRNLIAAALISVLGGSTIGLGIGVGIPLSQNHLVQNQKNDSSSSSEAFKFPENDTVATGTFTKDGNLQQQTIPANETQVNNFTSVFEQVAPSVVNIISTSQKSTNNIFGFDFPTEGAGSGVIFHSDELNYYIVTNYHVVQGADNVSVSISEKGDFPARLIGKNEISDIAVISIEKIDVEKEGLIDIQPAKFGDSDAMKIGDPVLAIGNALGEGNVATNGIISAKDKKIRIDQMIYTALQTNAAINPGNSGGPLINLHGEVIGINSAKLSSYTNTGSGYVEGMGYSIPSNDVKTIIEDLMGPKKPMLGVSGMDMTPEAAESFNLPQAGVLIESVVPGSPAEKAGLQSKDVITGFNGITIFTFDDLKEAVGKCNIDDSIEIKFVRNGTEFKIATVKMFAILEESF